MANCSDAYGDMVIKIKGETDEETVSLLYLFKEYWDKVMVKDCSYYAEIFDWHTEWEDEGLVGYGQFNGCGRWAFEANCRFTYDWLKQGVERYPELKEDWERLNAHDWSVEYFFKDEEGGCEVLYEMDYLVEHYAGEDKAHNSIVSEEDYDYTPENLVKLGFYDNIEDARGEL